MKKIKIKNEINEKEYTDSLIEKFIENIRFNKILKQLNLKFLFLLCIIIIFSIYIFIIKFFLPNTKVNYILLKSFKKYINDCKKYKKYIIRKIKNKISFVSICLSALNMEKYIKQNLLSILNQSFQDFEIIIINDNSNDDTEKIIKEMQLDDNRIILINHSQNLGVYRSRIETILNAKSKYIMIMDPDDMYLNRNLIKELYNYNTLNNLDIIEFSVYQQRDGTRKIIYPDNHFQNHFHNFYKKIIYQPELSEILYYLPGTKQYSHTICRNIWNKLIRLKILLKVHHYIGNNYYNEYVITADDMSMNIILYNFANNYSNIDLPGYLYNIRKVSMSNGEGGIKLKMVRSINYLLYFEIFYKFIKDFEKDRNFLFNEMKNLNHFFLNIKNYNIKKYIPKAINFLKRILKDNYLSPNFKNYLKNLLLFFKK